MADLDLAENKCAAEEGNHDASAADSGYKRNHRPLITKRFEVGDISNSQQSPDKEDTPAPFEGSMFCADRPPENKQDKGHNGNRVNHKPDLDAYGGKAKRVDEVFVVKCAASADEDRKEKKDNPFISMKNDAFAAADERKNIVGDKKHAKGGPLKRGEAFAEDQHSAEQRPGGTGSSDWGVY